MLIGETKNQATSNYNIGIAKVVANLVNNNNVCKLLDYGAGNMGLIKAISENKLVNHKFTYVPYEPNNPKYAERPEPAEMVTCIDILEHIKSDHIDDILDDLQRLVDKIGFFTISYDPEIILSEEKPPEWWLPKIMERFELQSFQKTTKGFLLLVSNKCL